jgi:hypothetical protein
MIMSNLIVKVKKKNVDINLPVYKTPGSAGCDVFASEYARIEPGCRCLIPTGLYLEVSEGHECQVRPRSGFAISHGVTVLNSPGTIDCFAHDSVISTENGRMTTSNMKLGDVVFSLNEETMFFERDVVSALVDVGEREVLTFVLDDGSSISVTPNTLVYTGDGLKRAFDITDRDELLSDHDI